MKKVVAIDTLGLETNLAHPGWSWGNPPSESSDADFGRCAVRARLWEDDCEDVDPDLRAGEKYHYWRGVLGRDELFYQRTLVGGRKLVMHARGLTTTTPSISANADFYRFIRFRFNNLHSPGYHITDAVAYSLLMNGYAPLHCSAFRLGRATVVVVAPPDSGKTLTTMTAVLKLGARFMAEDVAVTDGEKVWACPWTSTFRYYDELALGRWTRFRMGLARVFPPAELLPATEASKTIDAYIGTERIEWESPITHVAVLARRPGTLRTLTQAEAIRLLGNLNRYEFNYLKSPMLVAASYFCPELDLRAADDHERRVFGEVAKRAKCLLVQSADPTRFAEMIAEETARS